VLQRVPAPEYPEWARRFRRHATVRLRVVVSPVGRVLEAEVVSDPAGFGFDAAARKAAMGAVFEPATVDGEPVRAEAMLIVRFDLSDSGR
jgi:TonB family protein